MVAKRNERGRARNGANIVVGVDVVEVEAEKEEKEAWAERGQTLSARTLEPGERDKSERPTWVTRTNYQISDFGMLFCPGCANMLVISDESTGLNKWVCQTCPYEFPITKQVIFRELFGSGSG